MLEDESGYSVSIHATLAGGDVGNARQLQLLDVSIHATLAGGDIQNIIVCLSDCVSIHATLAGGDGLLLEPLKMAILFLSTPPSRVATESLGQDCMLFVFLSTPPSRVATE